MSFPWLYFLLNAISRLSFTNLLSIELLNQWSNIRHLLEGETALFNTIGWLGAVRKDSEGNRIGIEIPHPVNMYCFMFIKEGSREEKY